jgi:hypothetical protein
LRGWRRVGQRGGYSFQQRPDGRPSDAAQDRPVQRCSGPAEGRPVAGDQPQSGTVVAAGHQGQIGVEYRERFTREADGLPRQRRCRRVAVTNRLQDPYPYQLGQASDMNTGLWIIRRTDR